MQKNDDKNKASNSGSASPGKRKVVAKMINRESLSKIKPSDNKPSDTTETKDDSEGNENLPNGFDSDDELDDNTKQQNDVAVPLKDEQGRDKISSVQPLPMFKKLFVSDI